MSSETKNQISEKISRFPDGVVTGSQYKCENGRFCAGIIYFRKQLSCRYAKRSLILIVESYLHTTPDGNSKEAV